LKSNKNPTRETVSLSVLPDAGAKSNKIQHRTPTGQRRGPVAMGERARESRQVVAFDHRHPNYLSDRFE
jgi:hypothetical protein